MRKFLALLSCLLASPAAAQTYPSPTFNNVTLNGGLFFNNCTGIVVGQGPAAATCASPVPTAYLPVATSGAAIPLMSANNTWSGQQTFAALILSGRVWGSGSAPVVSSCGTSPSISTGANDTHGTITTGTGSPSSCTITWATPRSLTPDCSVDAPTGVISTFTPSTTTLVINYPATSSAKLTYICMGQ